MVNVVAVEYPRPVAVQLQAEFECSQHSTAMACNVATASDIRRILLMIINQLPGIVLLTSPSTADWTRKLPCSAGKSH